MRPAGYVRVSRAEQIEGYSLDAQVRAIEAFCAARGWGSPAIYTEGGRSAYSEVTAKRPQFAAMLDAAVAGQHDTIVVHKLDRFARSLITTLRELKRLDGAGVAFASVSEQIDFTTPIGKVLLAMLAAFAEYFSANLSAEVKKGLREKEARGLHIGPVPWGAIRVDGRLQIDPAREDDLRRLLEMSREDSAYTVVKDFNRRGVPTPRGAARWWPQIIRRMVTDGHWLATMPEPWPTLWRQARARPPLPRAGNGTRPHLRALSGLMRCACGEAMQYTGQTRTLRDGSPCSPVRCRGRRERGTGERCPGGGHTRGEEYERQVEAWFLRLLVGPRRADLPARAAAGGASARDALAERRRLLLLALADGLPEPEYRKRKLGLDREEAALPPAEGEAVALLSEIVAAQSGWGLLAPVDRNAIYRLLIRRVVLRGHVAEVYPSVALCHLLGWPDDGSYRATADGA
jgi:DNA invertase Pin-like site-specific DNA recombinase